MKKVLIYQWGAFGMPDIIAAYQKAGYEVMSFETKQVHNDETKELSELFQKAVDNFIPDYVVSLNYYPLLSIQCQKFGIPYISIVYDSPLVYLYSCTVINSCNHIYLFDKAWYRELKEGGISNVNYLPLPINVERYQQYRLGKLPEKQQKQWSAEVSFVGALYDEAHNFYERMENLDSYTKGYLEGIMNAQQQVWGYYFIEELMNKNIIKAMEAACPYHIDRESAVTLEYIYANYFLARKITQTERKRILKNISEHHQLKLYTYHKTPDIPEAVNMGVIDYYREMPYVFALSKINLNITLRSIKSGMPLRALDIMASGGFLISNYQEDFLEYFTPEEEFVFFENDEDLEMKIRYYLRNDDIRATIAVRGLEKVNQVCDSVRIVKSIMEDI